MKTIQIQAGKTESKPKKPILVVEEEPNDIMFIRQAFQSAGLKEPLHVVSDSAEAIEYLQGQNAFDDRQRYPFPVLVLLDLRMGRKDGIDLLRWLRERPQIRRRIVVVGWTEVDLPTLANRAYDLGANSVLVKPFDYNQMVRAASLLQQYWLDLNLLPDGAQN